MLRTIKNNIKKNRKAKYQKVIFIKKDINLRKKAIQFIFKTGNNLKKEKIFCESCFFYSRYLNKKNFILFYKKFNSRLQLKEKYCKFSYKKKSNKNACFETYLLFSKFLINNKQVNNIQKLNTILKINDLLILIYSKNKHSNLVKKFMQNIKYEEKLLNRYL
jgi:hypothetical protein